MSTAVALGVEGLAARHGEVHAFPVSFAQRRFWVLDQLDEATAAYTIPVALELTGALDVDAFRRAIAHIVSRHEALRTVFVLEGDEPVQVVLPTLDVPVPVDDLRALDASTRAARLDAAIQDNLNRGFDLAEGPLVRMQLVRTADDAHLWLAAFHHIIADGVSLGILFGELETAYAAALKHGDPALPPLPLQYADFAVWQRKALAGAKAGKQLDYWRATLADLPTLELASDRPRPPIMTAAGGKRERMIGAEVVEGMRALARREGATPYAAFLTAFVALLHRYTAQEDLVVGSITAGRLRTEVEPLIGLFVNTLAIRADASGEPSFLELLRRVRTRAVEALAHQDVPFEQVVDAVSPERDRSRSPVFQVAFQLLESIARDLQLPGLTVRRVSGAKDTSKFDLTLMLAAAPGGALRAVLEYRSDLYDVATVDRMLGHFEVLLAAAVRDPSQPIGALPLLTADEAQLVVRDWNATAHAVPAESLHALILAQAARTPDAIAVEADTDEGVRERLTFRQLAERATVVARFLKAQGVQPNTGVGICIERSADLVVAIVGVLASGAYYVPLDPAYPADRVAYMLTQSGVGVLLTVRALGARLPIAASTTRVIALDADWAQIEREGDKTATIPAPVEAEDLAYVIYTSGSTGRPKGVMIPHRAVVNYVTWMGTQYPVGGTDAILQKAPASFDACIWEFFLPLVTGARLVLAKPGGHQDPEYLAEVVKRTGITVLQLVPSQLQMMLEATTLSQGTALRRIVCGGEALPAELLGRLASVLPGVAITNLYGPTETTVYSTHWTLPATGFDGTAPIGTPIFNTQVYIVDPRLRPLPVGVPGELVIGGRGVARGYFAQPELTAEKFVPDAIGGTGTLYRTGDLARWRADGNLEYLGRRDHQVKLRGFRIELGEIESALASHPAVRAAVAIVREDVAGDKRLVAYVVCEGAPPTVAELKARVKERLPEFMVPSAVLLMDALPMNANGKLDRKALPAPEGDAASDTPFVAPRTPLEQQVADVWSAVLGRERVGVEDDFFALGGHSLLAMRVVGRLSQACGVRLTIGAMFEARTVAGLAGVIEARQRAGAAGAREVIAHRTDAAPAPLTHGQELLWVHEQMVPGSSAYNIAIGRRVHGALDVRVLGEAMTALVARHPALRSRFVERDGVPMQETLPPSRVTVTFADVGDVPASERAARAERLLEEAARGAVDIASSTVPRVLAVRLADDDWRLLIVVHHIVLDGGSIPIVLRELAALYAAAQSGTAADLLAPGLDLGDIATWEREARDATRLEALTTYWEGQLRDSVAHIPLPTDLPATDAPHGPAGRLAVTLPPTLRDEVKAFARALGTTPFAVLLAACHATMARYAGGDTDLLVATPIAGRSRPELQGVVGHLASTLLLRGRVADDPAFADLVRRAADVISGAFAHDDIAFQQLIALVRTEGATRADAGFNVLFTMQDGSQPAVQLGGATLEAIGVGAGSAKSDLSYSVAETEGGLRLVLEYRSDRFSAAAGERVLGHFVTLLRGALAEPRARCSRLPLLDAAERSSVVRGFNATTIAFTGPAFLDELVSTAPRDDRAADVVISMGGGRLSATELDRHSATLAAELAARGVGRGSVVGVLMPRSTDLVVALLGILRAGAAYVPLDPDYPADRLAYMMRDASTPLVLTTAALRALVPGDALLVADVIAGEARPAPVVADRSPRDPAYVLYTSGSTGQPKGVVVPHEAIVNHMRWMARVVPLAPGARVLQKTPLSFDASVWEFWAPLQADALLVLASDGAHRDPALMAADVREAGVTELQLVPTVLAALLDVPAFAACTSLRRVFVGGEALPAETVRRLLALHDVEVHNLYGPAEATIDATIWTTRRGVPLKGDTVPIGSPIDNVRAYVLSPAGEPQPIGASGELWIAGTGVALGYHGRPDLTAERFADDRFAGHDRMYRTGDRARWRPDGMLEFGGRLDAQVKLRGVRIELEEVENALLQSPMVAAAAADVRVDGARGDRLVAWVVAATGATLDRRALLADVRGRLPAPMVPTALDIVAALPRSPSGKVDRRALPTPAGGASEGGVLPRTDLERVVAHVWREVLGAEVTDVEAGFAEQGGHSLLATRVAAQLTRIFRSQLTLRLFFESPTVAGLAKALVSLEAKPGQAALIAATFLKVQQMTPEERERLKRPAAPKAPSTGSVS